MENPKNQTTAPSTPQPAEIIRQWVTSPDGQNTIAANLQRAHALAAQFREAERVDPESLRKPITR